MAIHSAYNNLIEETYSDFLNRYDGFGKGFYERLRNELPEIFDKLRLYKKTGQRSECSSFAEIIYAEDKIISIKIESELEIISLCNSYSESHSEYGEWNEGDDAIGEAINEIRKETSKDFNLIAKENFLQFLTYFHFDSTKINKHTITRKFQLRVDLSEISISITAEQMANIAVELAKNLFNNDDTELWFLCYENDTIATNDDDYLNKLLAKTKVIDYYSGFGENIVCLFDDNLHTKNNRYEGKTTLIKAKLEHLPIKEIIYRQVANTVSLRRSIPQSICFFDAYSSKSFQLYSNGICNLWANRERADLFKLYLKYRHWIPENDIENTKAQFFPKNNIVN